MGQVSEQRPKTRMITRRYSRRTQRVLKGPARQKSKGRNEFGWLQHKGLSWRPSARPHATDRTAADQTRIGAVTHRRARSGRSINSERVPVGGTPRGETRCLQLPHALAQMADPHGGNRSRASTSNRPSKADYPRLRTCASVCVCVRARVYVPRVCSLTVIARMVGHQVRLLRNDCVALNSC